MSPRFLIIGFDALRPELTTPAHAPHLAAWLARAARFERSRSVFPSETKVAMASIATGSWPGAHGIVANGYYEPATGDGKLFDTGNVGQLAAVTEAAHGALVTAPTIGGLLKAAGKSYMTVSTGTAGNARFLNPRARDQGLVAYSIMGEDASSSAADFAGCVAAFGPPPAAAVPNTARCAYGAKLFLEHFLPKHQPDVAVLWLSEPDISFHYCGVGSPESLEALQAMDAIFGEVLAWRDAQPDAADIQIIALSDHGQVAVKGRIDIIGEMQAAGLHAADQYSDDIDYIVLASSSGNIWVRDNDPGLIRVMAKWLIEQDWLGMLFARDPELAPGALPLALVQNDHARTPPLYFVLQSDNAVSRFGLSGRSFVGADPMPGDETGGVHGGLHPAELSTVLAFEGGQFRSAVSLTGPAGLADISPTILDAFGLSAPGMQGRVLHESYVGADDAALPQSQLYNAGAGLFRQQLEILEIDGRRYLERGGRLSGHG